jgi:hypothetical protein
LTHNNIAAHLRSDIGDARVRYLNVQNFIVDLTDSMNDFFVAVRANSSLTDGAPLQPRFLEWAEICGFMAVQTSSGRSIAGPVATGVAATTRPLWSGLTPPVLAYPLRGTGAGKVTRASPSTTNSTLAITASGWCGFSDLGVSVGSWTVQPALTVSHSVDVGPTFAVKPALSTSKKKGLASGKKRRRK